MNDLAVLSSGLPFFHQCTFNRDLVWILILFQICMRRVKMYGKHVSILSTINPLSLRKSSDQYFPACKMGEKIFVLNIVTVTDFVCLSSSGIAGLVPTCLGLKICMLQYFHFKFRHLSASIESTTVRVCFGPVEPFGDGFLSFCPTHYHHLRFHCDCHASCHLVSNIYIVANKCSDAVSLAERCKLGGAEKRRIALWHVK